MKKIVLGLLIILLSGSMVLAFGGPAPEAPAKAAYPYLIDNFEDGTYTKDPEWFSFDGIVPSIVKTSTLREGDPKVVSLIGQYALNLTGSARDWYVGGLGTVLGIDASGYSTFEIDVYGYGEQSGKLKIELYDDDNGNADIEVDKSFKPLYDDLFSKEIDVNWTGWKHLSIPISEFTIEGRGGKKWDPTLANGSGGLVKIQLISVANSQTGSINYTVDNLELGLAK
ncbi:hypothetical protein HZC35_03480 [Candidatus Saganbacteria bacterium]|nr:hypothetical protein [Candidatus Saganbacteria bacterium]